VGDSADGDIPRVHLPVLLVQEALALQLAPVASVPVVVDSEEEASVVDEAVSAVTGAAVLGVTVEASAVALEVLLEEEVVMVVEEVASDIRTDMQLQKVLPLGLAVEGEAAAAASAGVEAVDTETIGHRVVVAVVAVVVVVATEIVTWAPAAPITNPSGEIVVQNVVGAIEEEATVEETVVVTVTAVTAANARVGIAAAKTATAHGNVHMRTTTTTGARDEGTELRSLAHGFVKGYLSFLRLVRLTLLIGKG
jgi:hypothetical protein